MGMIQIVTSPNEANAALIKGYLETNGIQASYAPNAGKNGQVASCTVYCAEEKSEEALKLLKEQGLIPAKESQRNVGRTLIFSIIFVLVIVGVLYLFLNKSQTSNPQIVTDAGVSSASLYEGKEVYIFVDETTYSTLADKISRLAADITNDLGVHVNIEHAAYSSPVEIRSILQKSYIQNKLLGSILIGDIPTFSRTDGFYTDWFYSSLKDRCPINSQGIFSDSQICNVLDSYSKREVFEGRITATVTGPVGIAMISNYLDKDHSFREGKIVFPKRLLLNPSVNIIQDNDGSSINKNSISANVASSIASQSRYSQQNVDTIYDSDYLKQKQSYLANLKNNRYETAMVSIHGSPTGQFPSGKYDESEITSADIITAKPNIFYVALLSCSNGAFKSPNYLAGEFLFNGDTLLVSANSQEAMIGGFLQDLPIQSTFFQPLSFLNSTTPFGELFRHDTSLYITQYFGDPTLRIPKNGSDSARISLTPSSADFGSISSESISTKTISVKNIGQSDLSILILPNWVFTINEKPLSSYTSQKKPPQVLPGRNFQGFISDQSSNGFFGSIILAPGEEKTFTFSFSPSETAGGKVISGVYKDSYLLLTSDPQRPYVDIPVSATEI